MYGFDGAPTILIVDPSDTFFSVLPLHHTYVCTCIFLMPLFKRIRRIGVSQAEVEKNTGKKSKRFVEGNRR